MSGNIEALAALIVAITGLLGAVGAWRHSVQTRKKIK